MSGGEANPEAPRRPREAPWARYVRFWDERESPEALATVMKELTEEIRLHYLPVEH